jgi:folate-binding protein YgfZ
MSTPTAAFTPFRARVPRDLVVVEGADATSFLQSLLSQDLDPVPVGTSVDALLLQPQGKLLVVMRATHSAPDTWSLDCEAGFGAVLAAGLERFKIRVNAEIRVVDGVEMLAVRGIDPTKEADALPAIGGYDVIGSAASLDQVEAAVDAPTIDAAGYERWRIEAGVPRLGLDVDEGTIPQEAGLDASGVSFTKGCFVGQELVCRIDTRGHVNRHLRRLRAEGRLTAGKEVVYDGKVVGRVTSSAGEVGLAMLRREVEPGDRVETAAVSATVEAI